MLHRGCDSEDARVPIGCYPGSFDPLTVAHVAVAEAAHEQLRLTRLDLVISTVALAKEDGAHATPDERADAIDALRRPWLKARVTDRRLISDIAQGYDVVVMGADKWHQLHDVAFYDGSTAKRREALSRLPLVAIAPRAGFELPAARADVVILDVHPDHAHVSSTAVRHGRPDWRA